MDKLVILDYSTGEVDIYPTDFNFEPDEMDECLSKLGHKTTNCEWMFAHGNITFHKEVLK